MRNVTVVTKDEQLATHGKVLDMAIEDGYLALRTPSKVIKYVQGDVHKLIEQTDAQKLYEDIETRLEDIQAKYADVQARLKKLEESS